MESLAKVTVNFDTSHLIFPKLIACVLALLGLAIVVSRRREIAGSLGYWRDVFAEMDKLRFFGTIALTLVYFSAMVPVGDFWPNTGLGFLICSVPYIFLTGLLFLHERDRRGILTVFATAIIAPVLVWFVFGRLFFLTLP